MSTSRELIGRFERAKQGSSNDQKEKIRERRLNDKSDQRNGRENELDQLRWGEED